MNMRNVQLNRLFDTKKQKKKKKKKKKKNLSENVALQE